MAQFLLPLCNAHGGPTWGQFHLSYLPLIKFFPHVRKEISGHPGGLTNHPYVRKSTCDTPLLRSRPAMERSALQTSSARDAETVH